MSKISFESDYITGAHPEILKRFAETNFEPVSSYGADVYSESAKAKIKKACSDNSVEVYFLTGGTQTNQIVISSLLKDYEGVVSADTGHIGVHEAGAIEYTGHKVLPIAHHNGKIDANELSKFLKDFYSDENYEHMVFPGMVYISHPTEFGTLYSKSELTSISSLCREYNIPLYMDGARLGYGIMSNNTDVTLSDIAKLCDAFYIGGTKVGALCGEAVVFNQKYAPKHFMTLVKQHGALLAKGRILGIQFDTLFTDDLYFKISKHAIDMAELLKDVLAQKGCRFAWESPTNQQFVVFENSIIDNLRSKVGFSYWEKADDTHTVVRFATTWSTTEQDIQKLKELL